MVSEPDSGFSEIQNFLKGIQTMKRGKKILDGITLRRMSDSFRTV